MRGHREHFSILAGEGVEVDGLDFLVAEDGLVDAVGLGGPEGDSLAAVTLALDVAAKSQRIARQNFALAIGYNFLAVPLAMLGLVSPLIAAVAMSTSSIMVVANALRLGLSRKPAAAGTERQRPAAHLMRQTA